MKRDIDYYIGFTVSNFLSIKYLLYYGTNYKGILVVVIIQIVFQLFYIIYSKLKNKIKNKIKNEDN